MRKRLKNLTVSEELERQGFISKEDLEADLLYNSRHVPVVLCWIYKVLIIPIVITMRFSRRFSNLVSRIAFRVWLGKAIQGGYKLMNALQESDEETTKRR